MIFLGLHSESNALYEKANIILHQQFGDLHLLIANVLIGQCLNAREMGLYEQASSCIEQALSIRSVLLGDNHADTAKCYYYLASVQRLQGNTVLCCCSCFIDSCILRL